MSRTLTSARPLVTAALSGAIFAAGLILAGMTDPGRVQGFLDVGGAWDPRLALVMAAAIPVYALALALARRRARPAFAESFPKLPAHAPIDARLVGGAALFGVGWGLAGYCPGPALVSLGAGHAGVISFVLAMVAGMFLVHLFDSWRARVMLGRAS